MTCFSFGCLRRNRRACFRRVFGEVVTLGSLESEEVGGGVVEAVASGSLELEEEVGGGVVE
jgi:hypothetical protein